MQSKDLWLQIDLIYHNLNSYNIKTTIKLDLIKIKNNSLNLIIKQVLLTTQTLEYITAHKKIKYSTPHSKNNNHNNNRMALIILITTLIKIINPPKIFSFNINSPIMDYRIKIIIKIILL